MTNYGERVAERLRRLDWKLFLDRALESMPVEKARHLLASRIGRSEVEAEKIAKLTALAEEVRLYLADLSR